MTNRVAVDIGNTRISLGYFAGDQLQEVNHFFLTKIDIACRALAEKYLAGNFQQVALSSVVPEVSAHFRQLLPADLPILPISVKMQNLLVGTYPTLGSDRLANAVGAYKLYAMGRPAIVFDFGTATTLTAVDQDATFLGGMIGLGLETTVTSLYKSGAQLPDLHLELAKFPINPLATDTGTAMISGCLLGHVGMIENWLKHAKERLGGEAYVVATGGHAETIKKHTSVFDEVNSHLTLQGINFIAAGAMGPADRD